MKSKQVTDPERQPSEINWAETSAMRSLIYGWLARAFAREYRADELQALQNQTLPQLQPLFVALELAEPFNTLVDALEQLTQHYPPAEQALELAADFAQLFLLGAKDSAPPYASHYLEDSKQLYGKTSQVMRQALADNHLILDDQFKEPEDHLSVYLSYFQHWLTHSTANDDQTMLQQACQQLIFLEQALDTWLPHFNQRCQQIPSQHTVYPALSALLLRWVEADKLFLSAVGHA